MNFQTGKRRPEPNQNYEQKPHVGCSETIVKYDPSQTKWDFPLKVAHDEAVATIAGLERDYNATHWI